MFPPRPTKEFDADDNKYSKSWAKSKHVRYITGIICIVIFVCFMKTSTTSIDQQSMGGFGYGKGEIQTISADDMNSGTIQGTLLNGKRVYRISTSFPAETLSISVWINIPKSGSNYSGNQMIIFNQPNSCPSISDCDGIAIYINMETLSLCFASSGSLCSSIGSIILDQWTLVGLTISQPGTGAGVSLYIDGKLSISKQFYRELVMDPTYIGSDSSKQSLFIGRMHSLLITDRTWNHQQMESLYSNPQETVHQLRPQCNGIFFALEEGELLIDAPNSHYEENDEVKKDKPTTKVETIQVQNKIEPIIEKSAILTEITVPNTNLQADQLWNQYITRPDHYSPPSTSLRTDTLLPPPPEEKDEMCTATPPKPIPVINGLLKQFSDQLLEMDPAVLITGQFAYGIPTSIALDYHYLSEYRAQHVRDATCFTWANYKIHAWGRDELAPITGGSKDNWGGVSMTAIDSIDTLYLMKLIKEAESIDELVNKLDFNMNRPSSVFELNIRITGGLITMHDLTGKNHYLDKAHDLVKRMLPAFNTKSGYPLNSVNLSTGDSSAPNWTGGSVILAEIGTLSLEFLYVASKTGNTKIRLAMDKLYKSLQNADTFDGMLPMKMNQHNGKSAGGPYSMSGGADSYYEYLVKMWIMDGKKDETIRSMYNKAVDGITKHLLKRGPTGLLYTSEFQGGQHGQTMGHLACFTGGMLALGVLHNINPNTRDRDLANAKSLAYTCYQMYISTNTGVSSESMHFGGNKPKVNPQASYYILRPEALETMYYLNHITGDPIYREWGWVMWSGIERSAKTKNGYGHLHNADNPSSVENNMESFFLAETVKYAYLLFKDDKVIDLTKQVLNTEAHPIHVE